MFRQFEGDDAQDRFLGRVWFGYFAPHMFVFCCQGKSFPSWRLHQLHCFREVRLPGNAEGQHLPVLPDQLVADLVCTDK